MYCWWGVKGLSLIHANAFVMSSYKKLSVGGAIECEGDGDDILTPLFTSNRPVLKWLHAAWLIFNGNHIPPQKKCCGGFHSSQRTDEWPQYCGLGMRPSYHMDVILLLSFVQLILFDQPNDLNSHSLHGPAVCRNSWCVHIYTRAVVVSATLSLFELLET